MKHQHGFTLIEILVTTALGALLLTLVLEALLGIYRTNQLQQALNAMQENGRFAVYALQQSIHAAGDDRCEENAPEHALSIQGYAANAVPAAWHLRARAGTDVLVIGRCRNFSGRDRWIETAYFVAKTSLPETSGQSAYGLFEKRWQKPQRELANGIERLQFRYGLAKAHQTVINRYVQAFAVNDWQQVRSVEANILLVSARPVLRAAEPYQFAGHDYGTSRYLHGEWDLYAGLRGREVS